MNIPVSPQGGVLTVQQVQVWQGQFPPPEAIERYERALPGSFDRIIAMAERQQQASIEISSNAQKLHHADVSRGHYLGAAVTFSALSGAVYCAILGQVGIGLALVGIPVISVARTLVEGLKQRTPTLAELNQPSPSTGDEISEPQLPL